MVACDKKEETPQKPAAEPKPAATAAAEEAGCAVVNGKLNKAGVELCKSIRGMKTNGQKTMAVMRANCSGADSTAKFQVACSDAGVELFK